MRRGLWGRRGRTEESWAGDPAACGAFTGVDEKWDRKASQDNPDDCQDHDCRVLVCSTNYSDEC